MYAYSNPDSAVSKFLKRKDVGALLFSLTPSEIPINITKDKADTDGEKRV